MRPEVLFDWLVDLMTDWFITQMRRPSAVVVNEKDEIFVKDDHCLYHFDSEGHFIKTMGKKMMNAPYGG